MGCHASPSVVPQRRCDGLDSCNRVCRSRRTESVSAASTRGHRPHAQQVRGGGAMTPASTLTLEAIQKGLSVYFQPNGVHEIRIFESDRKNGAVSLLFDGANVEGAATAIFRRAR